MGLREVYLPKPGALWDKYNDYALYIIRKNWLESKLIFNSIPTDGYKVEDKIAAWYHLMVFTEILKTRHLWDAKRNCPIDMS